MKFVMSLACALILIVPARASAQRPAPAEAEARALVARWNTAYRSLDAAALAALFTADAEIVDRFGHLVRSEGSDYLQQLWQKTFTEIYKGKPGPERKFESVRVVAPDVMIVQASAQWDVVRLDDGTIIPPHGEIDTFVVVRRNDAWRVAALNIHNQMAPGSERPGERVPGR